MTQRRRPLTDTLAATLMGLGVHVASAAPFGAPFIALPEGSAGNGGDTSAYFGLQLDPNTFDPVYPAPNVYGCANSAAGGGICRTDFNNFDTRYRYDSVRWRMQDGGSTGLIGNISWKDSGMDMFRKIYFGYAFDANAPGNVVPAFGQTINYSLYSDFSGLSSSRTYQLTTEAIFLDHVRLNLDGVRARSANPLWLLLDGPNPAINLSNSSLLVGSAKLQVGGARFSINALQGVNSIEQLNYTTLIGTPTAITISPGAWLSFSDVAQGLEFRGRSNTLDAVGLNQDGGLELKRGKLKFINGVARFSQGAALHLEGSETSAVFDRMQFSTGAKIAMGNGTSLEAHTVSLKDASATLGSGASLLAKTIQVSGDNRIDSEVLSARWGVVQTDFLGMFDGSRLDLNGLGELKVKGLTQIGDGLSRSGPGAVFNLNRSNVTAYGGVDLYNGSELNLTDLSSFTLRPDKGSHESPFAFIRGATGVGAAAGNPARIHVGAASVLNVVYGGQIDLSDEVLHLNIDPTGSLAVKGNLRGSGHIEGDGAVVLKKEGTAAGQKVSGGWLFPGTRAQPIATLSTDTALYFEQGSQLRVNVGKDSQGQLAYGKVLYGAGNVFFDGNTTLALSQVANQAPLSAPGLNGRSITLLSARDAAVTGTIKPSVFKPVVDVSAMPALLAWRVVDLQTNQHPDITLEADLMPYDHLQKGNGSGNKGNRGRGLGLMVAAATQNPNGPIAGALNTLTNSQLGVSGTVTSSSGSTGNTPAPVPLPTPAQAQGTPVAQQNSWHPEPYSSYIATGFAQVANLRNMVFERAALANPSGTQVWVDAAGFRGSIDGQGDLGSYSYRMSQLVVGKDMGAILGGAWGAYVAVNDRKIDESDLETQDISGTTAGLGAYWRHEGDTWTTLAQWGLAHGWHDSDRLSTVAGQSSVLHAKYNSDSMQAAVRFSAPWFDYKGIEVSHEFGGSVSVYHQEAFDETGDPTYGFHLKEATAEAYIAHVGAHVRFPSLPLQAGLRPVAFARFEHDFANNSDHAIKASLLANPQSYEKFVGQGRGPNSTVMGLGLITERPGPWQVQVGVSYALHTHGHDWGAGLDIRYSW